MKVTEHVVRLAWVSTLTGETHHGAWLPYDELQVLLAYVSRQCVKFGGQSHWVEVGECYD